VQADFVARRAPEARFQPLAFPTIASYDDRN
jgi:hypothetical protein